MRKASLFLSITPFVVALILVVLLFSSYGLEGMGFLVALFFALPVLAISSVVSVVLAFRKTDQLELDIAAKIMGVISAVIFCPLGIFATIAFFSVQSQYAAWT